MCKSCKTNRPDCLILRAVPNTFLSPAAHRTFSRSSCNDLVLGGTDDNVQRFCSSCLDETEWLLAYHFCHYGIEQQFKTMGFLDHSAVISDSSRTNLSFEFHCTW